LQQLCAMIDPMNNKARAKPPQRTSAPAGPPAAPRTWHLVLVLAVAFGCYVQTAGYQFVWDDNQQIAANDRIRSFANLGAAFQENFWAFLGPNVHGHYYRPLQTVSYMIGYALGGASPWPYRWICVLFHGVASLMVVWLAWELSLNPRNAFWAGMLFAAHPMHTESVA
jgi:protein O-mannosyl-transferase